MIVFDQLYIMNEVNNAMKACGRQAIFLSQKEK